MKRALALCSFVFVSCVVGPTGTFRAFEEKATTTAEAVVSAVETARIAAVSASSGDLYPNFASVVISEAEEDATEVRDTFASLQSPDRRSDALRRELDEVLARAVAALGDVRIAIRRGDLSPLDDLARVLRDLSKGLERFVEEHS